MREVTIYTKPWCGYCRRAKRLLASKGVEFREIDVTSDPSLEAEMIRRSGSTTAPQIFVGERHLGDSDDLVELEHEGRLDAILDPDADGAGKGEG